MNWITCPDCEEEFRVITDSLDPVLYCPLCGGDIEEELEEDELDDE